MTVMAARPSSADFLKGAVRRNIFPLMESHYEAELDEVLLRPIAPLNPTSPSPSAPPPPPPPPHSDTCSGSTSVGAFVFRPALS